MQEELFSALEAIGVSVCDKDGTFRNFSDVVADVKRTFNKMEEFTDAHVDNPDLFFSLKRQNEILKFSADKELRLYRVIVGDNDGKN